MDFWGIDRAQTSIRLSALKKLGRLDAAQPDADLKRLSKVLASRESQNAGALPIYPKEFEVLLALAESAKSVTEPQLAAVLAEQLSGYLVDFLTQDIVPSPSIRALAPSPWYVASKLVTEALVGLRAPVSVFQKYLNQASAVWPTAKEDKVIIFAFSLSGFLDGLADSDRLVTLEVGSSVHQWVRNFMGESFLSELYSRLGVVELAVQNNTNVDTLSLPLQILARVIDDPMYYPGPTQLTLSASQLTRTVARVAIGASGNGIDQILDNLPDADVAPLAESEGPVIANDKPLVSENQALIKELAAYSGATVQTIENSQQFRASVSPHLIPISTRSAWNHFEVLGIAVAYGVFPANTAFEYFLAAAETDQVDSRDDSIYNLLRLAMICVREDESRLAILIKSLPGYLGAVSATTAEHVATIFVKGLKGKPESWVISTIYALANTLSLDEYLLRKSQYESHVTPGVSQAEGLKEIDYAVSRFAESILSAIVAIVVAFKDTQVNGLALTVLSQKYGSVNQIVDKEILASYARLAPHLSERELDNLLQQIVRAETDAREKDKTQILAAVEQARVGISRNLSVLSPSYLHYLDHLLSLMIGAGDVGVSKQTQSRSDSQISAASKEAVSVFAPLAALLPSTSEPPLRIESWQLIAKFRDAWFNLVVLGFSRNSQWTPEQTKDLEIIARSTPPLVSEKSANKVESDLELNPVLLRGSSNSTVGNQRKIISGLFNLGSHDVGRLSFVKLMFLSAAVLVEYFRARGGVTSIVALYFGDPDLRTGSGFKDLTKVANDSMSEYISYVQSRSADDLRFDQDAVAGQLKELLILSCHRVAAIRDVALNLADELISKVPSSLVHPKSLFALLDLLTLMWQSCVDAEEDEYEPRTVFKATRSGVTIELSDSYEARRFTLKKLLGQARRWSGIILTLMAEEVKSLLTYYLDDLENTSSESFDTVAIGRSFALEMGGSIGNYESILGDNSHGFSVQGLQAGGLADGASGFLSQYLSLSAYRSQGAEHLSDSEISRVLGDFDALCTAKDPQPDGLTSKELRHLYARSASLLSTATPIALQVVKMAVHIPFRYFGGDLMRTGVSFWLWIINRNPELRMCVLQAVADHWSRSIYRKIGLFSRTLDELDPLFAQMEYAPTNKKLLDYDAEKINKQYEPHVILTRFLRSSLHTTALISGPYIDIHARIIYDGMFGLVNYASKHPLSRSPRLDLLKLSLELLTLYSRHRPRESRAVASIIVQAALSWYKQRPVWPHGGNLIQQRRDINMMIEFVDRIKRLSVSSPDVELLLFLLEEELNRMQVWYDPLGTTRAGSSKYLVTSQLVANAWRVDPEIAVYLLSLHSEPMARNTLTGYIEADPLRVIKVPDGLQYFVEASKSPRRRYILYWAQVSPIESISLFAPEFGGDSFLLQYAMRSLESHPILTAFFYVPHIVQSLRHDSGGYVEEYILEAAKFSEKFAHQIIWNILANQYKDNDEEVPDPMKPTLDRVLHRLKEHFSTAERAAYETEFGFFNEVTSISGKLKPYIKKSKAEKKAKIDEEMALIEVPEGAYLPSNPHGVVVDIDRESGRPLQSHAKAPFLARFLIRKDVKVIDSSGDAVETTEDVWQGAIFKVGDDCRQDVLALQLISVFRSIFNYTGLDVYLFPNKVTATGAGSGVIDVLPNSISRDMLGREAVNGLYEWFISKHGNEDSINFQRARNNFVKSMAAYSVISYLLQFKDRHNGNIMYDDDGHVLHIDFGFIFDVVPGGVKFEAVPFKLTKEMVAVMGGSSRTQPYKWFEELCVKAYLACRVHAEDIIRMVDPMIESGLPCFKPDTIKKLRNRFVLGKTEREAAQFMRSLISKSYESNFTKGYDEFQRLTNGIPY